MLDLPRTRAALERGIADGLHAGAQLCALRRGDPAELALGLAADSIVFWFSRARRARRALRGPRSPSSGSLAA